MIPHACSTSTTGGGPVSGAASGAGGTDESAPVPASGGTDESASVPASGVAGGPPPDPPAPGSGCRSRPPRQDAEDPRTASKEIVQLRLMHGKQLTAAACANFVAPGGVTARLPPRGPA